MRFIEKDERAIARMGELGETYQTLSDKLKTQGLTINAKTLYRYITRKETPSKSIKKEIATALKCLVSDIF